MSDPEVRLPGDLSGFMSDVMEGKTSEAFYLYEPWDVPPERRLDHYSGFQTSFHLSCAKTRLMIAGNRTGKTAAEIIEAVIMMTGEIPHSLRHPPGFVTSVPRAVDDDNKARWGHLDPLTHTWTPPKGRLALEAPSWPSTAPCGFVTGVGVYPSEKISRRRRDTVWIGTWKAAKDEKWVKELATLIPSQFLDTRFNADGYSRADEKFVLTNGNSITMITYERGPERAQAAGVWAVFLDEEPKNRKFWTECDQRLIDATFTGWMTMGFTPLFGLSWAYHDLFLRLSRGEMKDGALFHASQYDSPYIDPNTIEDRKAKYKPWEIRARVDGQFSEMEGRPYFDWEKLVGTDGRRGWMGMPMPTPRYIRIVPVGGTENSLRDVMRFTYINTAVEPEERKLMGEMQDYWEVYEEGVGENATYFMSIDTAEGSMDPDMAEDANCAKVLRLPVEGESKEWPVVVATLRTRLPTFQFTRMAAFGAVYWNGCLLVPETKGESGGTLVADLREYPFVYHSTVLNDKSRRMRQKWGFDTNSRTRRLVWDLVGDWIDDHEKPWGLGSTRLLGECAQAIVGKGGRPDHPPRGHSDEIMSFGIGLYAFRYDRGQINNNRKTVQAMRHVLEKPPFSRYLSDQQQDPTRFRLGQQSNGKPGPCRRQQRGILG